MEFISDAHALLWHLYWPRRLGEAAQQIFADADAGHKIIRVPSVVVAEIIMVVQKGRLTGASLDHLIPTLHSMNGSENYPLIPLLPKTVIESHEYTIIPDIFDRLIVTEAIKESLPLITRDQIICESGLVSTIWD